MELQSDIKELLGLVTTMRRDLHQIPELGLKEIETARYIRRKLTEFGIHDYEPIIETGTIVIFNGQQPGRNIAFRADIDALPVAEKTGVAFASKHAGRMHACGHDGHTATLLAFAKYLHDHPEKIKGRVLLIFQPAEEGPGGAQLIINTGIFEKYQIEKIVGLHVFPEFPAGKIACKEHAMMARNGEVTVRVHGLSAHGAQPQQGNDAILAAAAIISGLHSIVSRNISPMESAVLTFGEIHGGQAMNIIAQDVEIFGTMRAFSDAVYDEMVKRITMITEELAKGYGCTAEVEFNHMYRVVDNDPELVGLLAEIAGEDYITTTPFMLAEDFSMYQQVLPGMFFFVGTRNEEKGYTYPLHSDKMQFDEDNLLNGVEVYAELLEKLNA